MTNVNIPAVEETQANLVSPREHNHDVIPFPKKQEIEYEDDETCLHQVLRHYLATGECDYPLIQEIADRSFRRWLVLPSQANQLFANLGQLQHEIINAISTLLTQVREVDSQSPDTLLSSELVWIATHLNEASTDLINAVNQLLAIVEEHKELPIEAVDTGVATCYQDMDKRINDLRYAMTALRHLSAEHLYELAPASPFPSLHIIPIQQALEEIRSISNELVTRSKAVITSKLPYGGNWPA